MFSKSRKIVALGLAVTVATAGIALADGASDNDAVVDGKVTPSKLSKKRLKPVNLFLGVRNSSDQITGGQSNPASELISVSKNVKIKLGKTPLCTADLANGTTTEFAREQCPNKSYIGKGKAEVTAPTAACGPGATEPCVIGEPVVSVFHGPTKNELILHTYSPNLGPASPIVDGKIIKSPVNGYGQALRVDPAPETGAVMITVFNAKIFKSSKVAKAKCRPKKIKFQRTVVYKDDSSDTVTLKQSCKVKR